MERVIKLALIIVYAILLKSCNDDNHVSTEESIVGTWQLIAVYSIVDNASGEWSAIEDGYTYTFLKNGAFTSSRFSGCSVGTYSIEMDELILDYSCDNFTAEIENPDGVFTEKITQKGNTIEITPTYLNCIEGCNYRFKKI